MNESPSGGQPAYNGSEEELLDAAYNIAVETTSSVRLASTADETRFKSKLAQGLSDSRNGFGTSDSELNDIVFFASKYSLYYNVPLPLVFAVIEQESEFRHSEVISDAGAVGAMQVVPSSNAAAQDCKNAGILSALNDVKILEKNIDCGVYYLKLNYNSYGKTGVTRANGKKYFGWEAALAKYVGLGSRHPAYVEEVIQKCQQYDPSCPYTVVSGSKIA